MIFTLYIRFLIYIIKHRFNYSLVPVKVILSQAMLETGSFSSNIFHNNKNLFGMKYPQVRDTTASGQKNGFAVYLNYSDSIIDYFLRCKNFGIIDTSIPEDFMMDIITSGYCPDSGYIDTWISVYNSI